MSIKKANNAGLNGGRYNDANAGNTPIPDAVDIPTIGTASDVGTSVAYGNGTVNVPFTAAVTGGAAATFVATSSPGSITGSASSSPVSVQGLSGGTSYTFKVAGVNSSGTWVQSSSSNAVTATTVPIAPTIGTATVVDTTHVTLTFTPSTDTGGSSITSYAVTPSVALSDMVVTGGLTSPLTITATFAQNTGYTFTVSAVNANGNSLPSAASNQVVPLSQYALYGTYNSSSTFTVPSNASYVAVVGAGAGGNGASGGGNGGAGGAGGGGGAGFILSEYAVTPGQTYNVSVSGPGGATSFGNLVTANSGNAGGAGNISANVTLEASVNGGGAGGGGNGGGQYAGAGGYGSGGSTLNSGQPGICGITFGGGGGGGGGGGSTNFYGYGYGSSCYGGCGRNGAQYGGKGGSGGYGGIYYWGAGSANGGYPGNAANGIGGGGGGGGGGGHALNGQSGGNGGAGGAGRILIYTR